MPEPDTRLPSERHWVFMPERLTLALALPPGDVRYREVESAEQWIRDNCKGMPERAEEMIRRAHLEYEHDRDVREARAKALAALTEARRAKILLRSAIQRLSEPDLFDTEVEGKEKLLTAALTQVDVGLSAVAGALPAVDA